jgi:hypothetical protein
LKLTLSSYQKELVLASPSCKPSNAMSAIVKPKLKSAKEAIGKKDYAKAKDLALNVLDYEPDNYTA